MLLFWLHEYELNTDLIDEIILLICGRDTERENELPFYVVASIRLINLLHML